MAEPRIMFRKLSRTYSSEYRDYDEIVTLEELLKDESITATVKRRAESAKQLTIIDAGYESRNSRRVIQRMSDEQIALYDQIVSYKNEIKIINDKIVEETKVLQEAKKSKEKTLKQLTKQKELLFKVK